MIDNNVYVKEVTSNGKTIYRPFGMRYDEKYMPDGIYYCHHRPGVSSTTNVDRYISGLYKIGDAEIPNLPKLCGLHTYADYVMQSEEFKKIMNSHSYCWSELVATILSCVFNLNDAILNYDEKRADK